MSDFQARLLRLEADTVRAANRLAADEIREAGLENATWVTASSLAAAPYIAETHWGINVSYGGSAPIAGALVEAFDPGGTLAASGTTDASGLCVLTVMVPASYLIVPYRLHVTAAGYNPSPYVEYQVLPGGSMGYGYAFLYP